MSKQKRVNPRRRPMTVAEARAEGQSRGISCAAAIILTSLLDGGFVTKEQIPDVWKAAMYLSDSIAKGYTNLFDLIRTLRDEYGVDVEV